MSSVPPTRAAGPAWGNALSLLALAAIAAGACTLQAGDWWPAMPRQGRWMAAAATMLTYALLCLWFLRPRSARGPAGDGAHPEGEPLLVAYASQTGFAQQLAERTAAALVAAGLPVKLLALGEVDRELLASTGRALFVASTTGEGDAPDPALAFVRDVMTGTASLQRLRYAVLALGDREYAHFCGFGHRLDDWLRQHGARPLFDLVEVDNADEGALRHWQHHLGQLSGMTDLPDWSAPRYEQWILRERRELNPGSVGGGAFLLSLVPPAGTSPQWQAGDIAEIGPRHPPAAVTALLARAGLDPAAEVIVDGESSSLGKSMQGSHLPAAEAIAGLSAQAVADRLEPLPHREYSISSLPADGLLQILLRRLLRADGTPGLASGWLCDHAPIGADIALRVRSNPNFHGPDPDRPMILIGNGTGMAGLRAHLKQRLAARSRRNWLLFGERNADRDFFHGEEIRAWHAQGLIERLDLAFSRDQPKRIHVQHVLLDAADVLRDWVHAGASIYVCGSLAGMAPGVDAVLRQVLGDAEVENLLASGRYRRDVY